MRIIGGALKGQRFEAADAKQMDKSYRPTSEKVREAIFSSLQSQLEFAGLRVLDLYAGSGSLGIEALSRGASQAVFVESHREAAERLRKNLAALGLQSRAQVIQADVSHLKPGLAQAGIGEFELIFADPPYQQHPRSALLDTLQAKGLVADSALLLVESASRDGAILPSGSLEFPEYEVSLLKEKKYGDTLISYFCFKRRRANAG